MLQIDFDHAVDIIRRGPGNDKVQFLRRDRRDRYFGCEHFSVIPHEDPDRMISEDSDSG